VIYLFVKMARKVDEATDFVLVQLIEQEPDVLTNAIRTMPGGTK
jgi:hypothetical protein